MNPYSTDDDNKDGNNFLSVSETFKKFCYT